MEMAAIVIVIKNPQKRHNFCNIRAIFEFFSDRAGPEKSLQYEKKNIWLWPFFEANPHRFFIPILEHCAMVRQVILYLQIVTVAPTYISDTTIILTKKVKL